MKYAIAVLDIGKTNKKVALYDDNLKPLTVRKRKIETFVKDGLDIEDIDSIVDWFLDEIKDLSQSYDIRSITVTTHGSTLVCVDEDGNPSVPTVAYTNEVDEDFHRSFWDEMGDPAEIQRVTATAEVKPLINAAKLLWFMKNRWPEDFARTRHILLYPQYFSYRLTGKIAADISYVGCHGYLWDFGKKDWSVIADKLGVRGMLPTTPGLSGDKLGVISPEIVSRTGLSPDTSVSLGVHDSNSSLIPYLISQEQDFVLNSTGTWCVAMHPAEEVHFQDAELGKMVFYNLSYEGKPVKTSILLGGLEYAFYTEILMKRHERSDWPDYLGETFKKILDDPQTFILPSIVPGSGQFPDSIARIVDGDRVYSISDLEGSKRWPPAFESYETGFALANLSLAIQTRIALQRVDLEPGTEVFIEGGFRQNPNYGALLGALLPDNPIYITALVEATSFGAALCGKAMVDGVEISSLKDYVKLDKQAVTPARLDGLEDYVSAWMANLG